MALMGAVAALTAAWIWLARRSFFYVLPVYFVAVAIDAPFTPVVVAYPDLGFGGLTESLVKVGDILLMGTVALSRTARAELLRPMPALLIGLSVLSITLAWLAGDFPMGSILLLGTVPLRFALLLALFSAASVSDEWRDFRRAGIATILLFGVPVGLLLASTLAPSVGTFAEAVGMATGEGRIAFVGLGNNKIGVCLTILVAALLIGHGLAKIPLRPWVVALSAAFTAAASLRFSTTGLLTLLLVAALCHSRLYAGLACLGSAVGLGAVWFVLGDSVSARSLSVVTGEFDYASDSSLGSRGEIWAAAFDVWQANPLSGRLGGWEWDRIVPPGVLQSPIETHSEFLWWMASFGIAGLGLLLTIVTIVIRAAARSSTLATAAATLVVATLALNAAAYFPAAAAAIAFLTATARQVLGIDVVGRDDGGRATNLPQDMGLVDRDMGQAPNIS